MSFFGKIFPIVGDFESGTKLHVFKGQKRLGRGKGKGKREGRRRGEDVETVGHVGYVLALAVSSDGAFLVS